MNWNALEWDRAAEELTWERVMAFTAHTKLLCVCFCNYTYLFFMQMLGLDGSLVFLVSLQRPTVYCKESLCKSL